MGLQIRRALTSLETLAAQYSCSVDVDGEMNTPELALAHVDCQKELEKPARAVINKTYNCGINKSQALTTIVIEASCFECKVQLKCREAG